MNYLIRCLACGSTCWVNGSYEWDTNALNLDDPEWQTDSSVADPVARDCPHEEFEVIDEEYDNFD